MSTVVASYAFYFLVGRYEDSWIWGWETDVLTIRLVFSPFLHSDCFHLLGNTVFLITGTLVESWMMFKRKIRYTIFLACYLISVEVSYLGWILLTPTHRPPVGLSGMISSSLAFAFVYCVLFRRCIRFRGRNLLALASIMLLLTVQVWNILGVLAALYSSEYLYPILYHSLAFLEAGILGLVLFLRLREGVDQQQGRKSTLLTKHTLPLSMTRTKQAEYRWLG